MMFLFNWVIFRFQPFIFWGVGDGFNDFLIFTPILREMIQFDLRIFFRWVVQAPENHWIFPTKRGEWYMTLFFAGVGFWIGSSKLAPVTTEILSSWFLGLGPMFFPKSQQISLLSREADFFIKKNQAATRWRYWTSNKFFLGGFGWGFPWFNRPHPYRGGTLKENTCARV